MLETKSLFQVFHQSLDWVDCQSCVSPVDIQVSATLFQPYLNMNLYKFHVRFNLVPETESGFPTQFYPCSLRLAGFRMLEKANTFQILGNLQIQFVALLFLPSIFVYFDLRIIQ